MTSYPPDWREFGVRIVRHDQLDAGTSQTPGMHREAAVSRASAGAQKLWAGTVTIQTGAETGPETANGTLPEAVEIPLAVFADSIGALDRDLSVVIYCASGYRSQVAASVLAVAGFRDVSDLLGGYSGWHAVGLPVAYDRDHIQPFPIYGLSP
jgi:rhodanese-related sulfurtransferase